MARVYVDPDRLEEFAARLVKFSLQTEMIYLDLEGRLRSLNTTWRDQEYEKFREAFEASQKLLTELTRAIEQIHPKLREDAKFIREYFRTTS